MFLLHYNFCSFIIYFKKRGSITENEKKELKLDFRESTTLEQIIRELKYLKEDGIYAYCIFNGEKIDNDHIEKLEKQINDEEYINSKKEYNDLMLKKKRLELLSKLDRYSSYYVQQLYSVVMGKDALSEIAKLYEKYPNTDVVVINKFLSLATRILSYVYSPSNLMGLDKIISDVMYEILNISDNNVSNKDLFNEFVDFIDKLWPEDVPKNHPIFNRKEEFSYKRITNHLLEVINDDISSLSKKLNVYK